MAVSPSIKLTLARPGVRRRRPKDRQPDASDELSLRKIRPASITSNWKLLMAHRKANVAILVMSFCVPPSFAQQWPREPIPARRILGEIEAHDSGLAVWWTGHNGWLIKADTLLIGTDLATDDDGRLYQSPITAAELAPLLDLAFITHKHGDHFNRKTARILAGKGKCIFVMPANCVEDARGLGIPENRIQVATPRKPMEVKGVKVSPLRDPRQP